MLLWIAEKAKDMLFPNSLLLEKLEQQIKDQLRNNQRDHQVTNLTLSSNPWNSTPNPGGQKSNKPCDIEEWHTQWFSTTQLLRMQWRFMEAAWKTHSIPFFFYHKTVTIIIPGEVPCSMCRGKSISVREWQAVACKSTVNTCCQKAGVRWVACWDLHRTQKESNQSTGPDHSSATGDCWIHTTRQSWAIMGSGTKEMV